MEKNNSKKPIIESMKLHEEWYKRAKSMKLEELPEFLKELMGDYAHDYGTICHALSAGAIAAACAMNNSTQGGITGFQAGALMWEFIRHWNYEDNKTGLKIVNFDDMLYPQYEGKFEKTISEVTWKALQEEAKRNLEEKDREYKEYLEKKSEYTVALAEFIKKYPDYVENTKKYDRIGVGTSAEFDAQREKEEAGFEFAPIEPFFLCSSEVIEHWKSITLGKVPFGFRVVDK